MRLSTAALGLVLTACYSSGEGMTPPLDRIYFPTGLATNCDSRADAPACQPSRLYVASSDFDLQFNAGSIQTIDLERVREIVGSIYPSDASDGQAHCGKFGEQNAGEQLLSPGPCGPVNLDHPQDGGSKIVVDSVGIGAFATDVILTASLTGAKKRLLLPVRGEASLHWIDIGDDGALDCGQTADSPKCDKAHRVGTDTAQTTRDIKMPAEPYAIAVSDENDAIVVTHQTTGQLSLFYQNPAEEVVHGEVQGWKDTEGPKLEALYPLSAAAAVAIAAAPEPWYVRKQRRDWITLRQIDSELRPDPFPPGFLVGYANSPHVDLVRFYADEPSSPSRPFIQGAAAVPIRANASGSVSRGIAFDDTERRACDEQFCLVDPDGKCMTDCANKSARVFMSNRSPSSLLVGATVPGTLTSDARDIPQFIDAMFLPIGVSRVYVGKVLVDGKLETRIFAVCFDQRRIAIYNPKSNAVEGFITTGRGPHAMAFDYSEDPPHALAYVGHFYDSYVGVVQLDQSELRHYGKIVLNLAERVAPRASK